jgi:hypothetical protein
VNPKAVLLIVVLVLVALAVVGYLLCKVVYAAGRRRERIDPIAAHEIDHLNDLRAEAIASGDYTKYENYLFGLNGRAITRGRDY